MPKKEALPEVDAAITLVVEDGDEDAVAALVESLEEVAGSFSNVTLVAAAVLGDEEEGEEEEAEEEEEIDLDALASAADDDEDEDAIAALTELAGEAELDPDDYETWADLAAALAEGEEEEESEEEGEEEGYTRDDLAEMDTDDLKAILDEWEIELEGRFSQKKAIDAILDAQGGEEEEEEAEEEEEEVEEIDEDALREMGVVELKKIYKEVTGKAASKGMKQDALVEAILEAAEEE